MRGEAPACGEAEAPACGEAEASASGEAEASASGEAEPPASSEAESPASSEAKSPASSEAEASASGEAEPPASSEAESPASGEAKTPASGEAKTPASDARFRTSLKNAPRSPLQGVLGALAIALACEPSGPPIDDGPAIEPAIPGYPAVAGPCGADVPAAPRFLAVTTTDFSTGALTIIDLETRSALPDVALGSTDALPYAHGGLLYLLHRFGIDALDALDPDDAWSLASQRSLAVPGLASANPHDLAIAGDARGYAPLFGGPEVLVLDFSDPRAPVDDGSIDLRGVADDDGNPEASLAAVCGDHLFVSLGLLDAQDGLRPRLDHDEVAVIDRSSRRLHDLDPEAEGVQSIALRGLLARQWRRDPGDPEGLSMLVLTTGLERLDLRTGVSAWVVADARLAERGITSYLQPQSFAVTADGAAAFIAAYSADYAEVFVDRWDLVDPNAAPEPLLSGLQSSERALEIAGDTLWVGDRTLGAAGVRGYTITEGGLVALSPDPLPTGLAPYAMTLIP
ncbi:MAG: hypothetical protein R3B09_31895 [Nannocystaceae bacterium]